MRKPVRTAASHSISTGSYADYLEAKLPELERKSKGERTRYRLKVSAARILETNGYQDVRVSDLCKSANVALGTFYVYFKGKMDISTEVILEFGAELYAQARAASRHQTNYGAIYEANRFFARAYSANPGLVRCLIQLDDTVPEFHRRWGGQRYEWITRLTDSIERRTGQRHKNAGQRLQVAYALEGMVFHFLYDLFVRGDSNLVSVSRDLDGVASLLSVLWYRALYGEVPPSADARRLAGWLTRANRKPDRGLAVRNGKRQRSTRKSKLTSAS
jgi:AcrR family transcriptional regulator